MLKLLVRSTIVLITAEGEIQLARGLVKFVRVH